MTSLSGPSDSLLFLYLAEFILGLMLFFIFRHFGKLYRRRFLYTWALSWMAFAAYTFGAGIMAVRSIHALSITGKTISVLVQLVCFLQVIMVLRGTYELVSEKALNKRQFKLIVVLCAVISFLSVYVFSQGVDPGNASSHNMLRTGSRALTTGLGFLVTGVVVWTNKKFSKGFGKVLLAVTSLLYSLYLLYIFFILCLNLYGLNVAVLNFYGVVDLLLISVMGMAMVMWLLEDERQKLDKANKELDRFLYSTSHDLRAPIASILGLTYLGRIEFQEERARTFMDMIEERIRKLDHVITDILSLSRSKKIDLRIEPLYLGRLVEETVTDIKFNKGASAIALDYQADDTHVFKSDYNQVKIILSNLLGNAVKYHNLNQPSPYIKISFRRNNDQVEISIEDNGQGIPSESLPRIFEMFYRASLDTEGTGLGLYIVNEALSKIKGKIAVTSALGRGSTFKILLENA